MKSSGNSLVDLKRRNEEIESSSFCRSDLFALSDSHYVYILVICIFDVYIYFHTLFLSAIPLS